MERTRVVIMGAAGRDFHNFNVVFRNRPEYEVVAFTATQIPNITGRTYPRELAGELYPAGIPIHEEGELAALIERHRVDQVVFSYSDVPHDVLMHKASLVLAAGADFRMLGARSTMLRSSKPVVSVCAVRTGCGKSPTSRKVASVLREAGLRVAVLRHPMPYGDLAKQAVQRFGSLEDMAREDCTIEEMEEYEPHIVRGNAVFAGVDYERILRAAEAEADVVLWDGGNNDTPFLVSDLEIVLVDPHRAGHERAYYPSEVNFLRASVLLVSKLDTAPPEGVEAVRRSIQAFNPRAVTIDAAMPISVEEPERVRGARVLVIEDGPTLTHGEMPYGAGTIAARQFGASELIDPRPFAVGSIQRTYAAYPHMGPLLPAMGYGKEQTQELEETIRRSGADLVLIATPIDLRRIVPIDKPCSRVRYELEEIASPTLGDVLRPVIDKARQGLAASR